MKVKILSINSHKSAWNENYIRNNYTKYTSHLSQQMYKGIFTPIESKSESINDERTSEKDQRLNGKHQRKLSLSYSLLRGLNTA